MRFVIVVLLSAGTLSACSTMDGVGRDIQAVGGGVSHLANEVRDEVFTSSGSQRRAEVGEACDPYAHELSGGSLPPCRRASPPPTPRQN